MTAKQYRCQHDAEKDGCFGDLYRIADCDGAICRYSCDKLKEHRYKMRKRNVTKMTKNEPKRVQQNTVNDPVPGRVLITVQEVETW